MGYDIVHGVDGSTIYHNDINKNGIVDGPKEVVAIYNEKGEKVDLSKPRNLPEGLGNSLSVCC